MTRSTTLSAVRPIPRRGLSRDEAAMYIGISASKFDELVRDRRMPAPKRIDGRKVWDIRDLDVAFDALPGENPQSQGSSWDDFRAAMTRISPSVRGPVRGPPRPCAPLLSSPWRQANSPYRGCRAPMNSWPRTRQHSPDKDAPAAEPKMRGEPGTFSRLAAQYFASPDFLRLRIRTQYVYRLVIERFLAEHGHRLVAEMRRDDVKKIMALKAATPGSANDLLKKIRTLIKFAIDTGWRTDDPTLRIKTFPEHEFHTWTEDEIAQYEERWPIGSRERTAFALHLYTGQRRSDVAHMAWTDVAGNAINVVQAKTGARLTIPLHPNLSAALRAWPRKHVVMLTTAFNKPFSDAGTGT